MTRTKTLRGYIIRNMGAAVEVHRGGTLLFTADSVPEAIARADALEAWPGEERIDSIGQNGNDGLHYLQEAPAIA